ncbi:MAG: class III extradiol dioxygenase family protein [Beijerinckiaceae bacterium]|jgi:protocatechuate 4,5-dioxygenase, beta chain|nr:class III extradiol dioxygenase family protein [Beijerinckiaceae bacterium]
MAQIVGGIATSHVPSIGNAIENGLQKDPYWKPFFDAFGPVHEWLDRTKPDAAVVIYNDHGLNFFLDKMPTFAVGAADRYENADEGWGLKVSPPSKGDAKLSWHLIDEVVASDFDLVTCQEMLVDHAFLVPMKLLWPDATPAPIPAVPVAINSIQHPLLSAKRCHALGKAIGKAIESYPVDARVVVIATGGLSHQLDGERAGFINKEFDAFCMDKIVNDVEAITALSNHEIIEKAGSQGVELMCWLAMRGAMSGHVSAAHASYHIPVSNTGGAVMVFDHQPASVLKAA